MKRILFALLVLTAFPALAAVNVIQTPKNSLYSPPSESSVIFPEYTSARALSANTNESVTIPAGATHVMISPSNIVWVKLGGTATVPTDTDDGTASEAVGANMYRLFELPSGSSSIGVISNATPIVTFSFYKTY